MIICICKDVSARDIARAVAGGCSSFSALQEQLEVGRACGTCLCSARETFAEHKAACKASCGGRAKANPPTLSAAY